LEEITPGVDRRLRQLAELVAADYDLLQTMIDDLWPTLVVDVGDEAIALDLGAWRELPLGLRRRALRRAAFQLCPGLRDLGFAQIEAARGVAESAPTGARVSLPGSLSLTVSYERLWISGAGYTPGPPDVWPTLPSGVSIPLRIPGHTVLSDDWELEAVLLPADDDARAAVRENENPWRALMDADRAGAELSLRTRRPGDRFQPLGMEGHSASLSDYMINARIPSAWRDQIPILVRRESPERGGGTILWVAGWRIDQRVRVRPHSNRILRLDFRRRESPNQPFGPNADLLTKGDQP
jgi:tRNA(Ile)-lysidine synthase